MPGDRPDWIGAANVNVTRAGTYTPIVSAVPVLVDIGKPGIPVQSVIVVCGSPEGRSVQGYVKNETTAEVSPFRLDIPTVTTYGGYATAYVPVQAGPLDDLRLALWFLAGASTDVDVDISFTSEPPLRQALYRADGRAYPVGLNGAFGNVSAGGTLIPAPGVGLRILIATCHIGILAAAGSTGIITVLATIGGTLTHVAQVGASPSASESTPNSVPPQGMLCDDNTAVTYETFGAPTSPAVSATYDLVS